MHIQKSNLGLKMCVREREERIRERIREGGGDRGRECVLERE